jgi:hypothetical protein
MATDAKTKPAKTITIIIDGDEYEVEDRETTVGDLLRLVGLDPAQTYLILQKGQGQEENLEDAEQPIKLHNKEKFLTGDRGPGQFA